MAVPEQTWLHGVSHDHAGPAHAVRLSELRSHLHPGVPRTRGRLLGSRRCARRRRQSAGVPT